MTHFDSVVYNAKEIALERKLATLRDVYSEAQDIVKRLECGDYWQEFDGAAEVLEMIHEKVTEVQTELANLKG